MRSEAEIISIMPMVAKRTRIGNSKRSISSRRLWSSDSTRPRPAPSRTSAFMKVPKPSATNSPEKPMLRGPAPENSSAAAATSAAIERPATRRYDPSPAIAP